jgi:hypothetical protein
MCRDPQQSPEVVAGRVAAVGGQLVKVELRLFERLSDCADIFGLVVPDQLGFLREVGTILRSAQSAIPHALVSDFVPLPEQHFARMNMPSTAYLSAQ